MKVRVWNAYASNNSGSYTIVGQLPSAEVAQETAEELREMIEAHTAWIETASGEGGGQGSPLAEFCRRHALTWSKGRGFVDDWPEHCDDARPRIVAVGHQVVVHHEYTVNLPPTFGEFFYKKGGRVSHEEDHAHHPLVTVATFWWGRSKEDRANMALECPRLIATLIAEDGELSNQSPAKWPPAWRISGEAFEAPLTVGVIFDELISGITVLRAAAEAHRAQLSIRVLESPHAERDPLAHLRPSTPQPSVPRFDVVVTNTGSDRPGLVEAAFETMRLHEHETWERLQELPATLGLGLPQPRADAAAARLRRAGATVELVRREI